MLELYEGSLAELKDRLLRFQEHYEAAARPFQWKFTRRDLDKLLSKLHAPDGMTKYVTEFPGWST
ncbi:MAG: hypothetical protein V3V55_02515 [Rhodospirillales bacterium]